MTFPSHILAASDRCKELREKREKYSAIISMLSESLRNSERPHVNQFLYRKLEKYVELEDYAKKELFELEDDLTRDVLVEQFIQKQRTNLKYSKPSDLLLA